MLFFIELFYYFKYFYELTVLSFKYLTLLIFIFLIYIILLINECMEIGI